MLLNLHLQNYALIDSLTLQFSPGLNVLTGETGAGKSIIIGALGLILGERASSEHIRTGSELAFLEAVFTPPGGRGFEDIKILMEEMGLPLDEELIVSREISAGGRNLCRINGRAVPLVTLKELGSMLVDLHGQHNHQSLLKTEQHLLLLDEFGDQDLVEAKAAYTQIFTLWQAKSKKLQSLGKNAGERKNQLELLSYQYDEIMGAALSQEEEENLTGRLYLLDNLEKILSVVQDAYTEVYSGTGGAAPIIDKLSKIKDSFSSLQKFEPRLAEFAAFVEEAAANLTELGHELYNYQDTLQFYPEEKSDIENRLEVYHRLKRKFSLAVPELVSFAQQCRERMETLQANEEEAQQLEKELDSLKKKAEENAAVLGELRRKTAEKLKTQVEDVLKDLGITGGRFAAAVRTRETLTPAGTEDVEFLFSANPGEELKPLAKIISTGEMARVMLALKCILAEEDRISTLVFDEIDSGVGGKTIQQVAGKMAELSRNHQIICVTHSPHIAGAADHQYLLFKEVTAGRTATRIRYLSGDERVMEIARMLDGNKTEITRKHAEELLKNRDQGLGIRD